MSLIERMRGKNIGDRQQPPALTNGQSGRQMHPKAVEALSDWNTDLEQLAYFKDRATHLENENKLNIERIRDLEEELTHTRNARDWFCRHDATMLATLDDVEALIAARKSKARAEAYAPPGSGAQETEPMTAEDEQRVTDLARALAPEKTDG